ncbi:hypothetical protein [Nocardia pseudovaccinii]|uniref:hypothetical protein n=1 Tax=Nocardia pseudovaccinii TaxID=189540 RepID=UPI0007A4C295|nr:hypothetical protein [Nocardia pseudovaccinii]
MRPHISIDIQLTEDDLAAALRADVLRGLTGSRRWLLRRSADALAAAEAGELIERGACRR